MFISLEEVQDFWTRYCERHRLAGEVLQEGLRQIARNHEYWSDHTMQELHDVVVKRLKSN
ncbi:MAG: hypothetical protein IT532_11355 [Burkholderiales bacterium]|nr:hypothetical protein [Burkholderiales bacterium]